MAASRAIYSSQAAFSTSQCTSVHKRGPTVPQLLDYVPRVPAAAQSIRLAPHRRLRSLLPHACLGGSTIDLGIGIASHD